MSTLDLILNKYKLPLTDYMEIPNVGRDDLAVLVHELDFKVGVEVGVQRGMYSEIICKANPQMKVYGVDPWRMYPTAKATETRTADATPQKDVDGWYQDTLRRMAIYPNYQIIKESSMMGVKKFEDNSIDFVYIDADHGYNFVMEDISEWYKKLRKGGIISGHDYYTIKEPRALMHVKKAVNDFVRKNQIKPLIIWGINARIPGTIRDKWRSWSFIK